MRVCSSEAAMLGKVWLHFELQQSSASVACYVTDLCGSFDPNLGNGLWSPYGLNDRNSCASNVTSKWAVAAFKASPKKQANKRLMSPISMLKFQMFWELLSPKIT